MLLWFEIDDFDAAVARAGELDAEVVLPVHRNPPEGEPGGPAHREIWLRDLDGYSVVLASPDGEVAAAGRLRRASVGCRPRPRRGLATADSEVARLDHGPRHVVQISRCLVI